MSGEVLLGRSERMLGFVIFGWPIKSKDYGRSLPAFCDYCRNQSLYHLVKTRRWVTIFFIPIFPLERADFYATCEICESSYELSEGDAKTMKEIREKYQKWEQGTISESELLSELETLGGELTGWDFEGQPQLEDVGLEGDSPPDRGFQ